MKEETQAGVAKMVSRTSFGAPSGPALSLPFKTNKKQIKLTPRKELEIRR